MLIIAGCIDRPKITTSSTIKSPQISEAFEHKVLLNYEALLAEKGGELGIISCSKDPELVRLEFDSLKPKREIYYLNVFCVYTGCYGPCGLPGFHAFETENETIFPEKGLEEYYEDLFEPIETEEEAREYIDHEIAELKLVNEALLQGEVNEKEDCTYLTKTPEVKKLISQSEEGFIYEGFNMQPEGTMELYYQKYIISNKGKITLSIDKKIAECGFGMVY